MTAMTQEEQDRDLADAQAYLGCTSLTVDRCRHESVTLTALWVFSGTDRRGKPRQIGSVTRMEGDPLEYRWECTRMAHRIPVARRTFKTLLECMGDMMRYEPQ